MSTYTRFFLPQRESCLLYTEEGEESALSEWGEQSPQRHVIDLARWPQSEWSRLATWLAWHYPEYSVFCWGNAAPLIYSTHWAVQAMARELLYETPSFVDNFLQNVALSQGFFSPSFKGGLQGIPAVICGAGDSLAHQRKELKAVAQKAFLIAAGSAVHSLQDEGIVPHLVAAIDPTQAMVQSMQRQSFYSVPTLIQGRLHPDASRMIHAPKLYLSGGEGHPFAQYFLPQVADVGSTVVGYAVHAARWLGCHPLILVGVDLGWKEEDGEISTRQDLLMQKLELEKLEEKSSLFQVPGAALPLQGILTKELLSCLEGNKEKPLTQLIHTLQMSLDKMTLSVHPLEKSLRRYLQEKPLSSDDPTYQFLIGPLESALHYQERGRFWEENKLPIGSEAPTGLSPVARRFLTTVIEKVLVFLEKRGC